jgi:hypothetical protein
MAVTSDGKTEARANVSKGNIFLPKRKKKVERLVVTSILSEKKKVSEALLFFFYFQYIHDDESVCT